MLHEVSAAPEAQAAWPASAAEHEPELARLAREAAAGDMHAWTDLVRRLDGVLHGVARRYRLPASDVDDVVQTTWLRALANVDQLSEPGAIAGWLSVIARREAMRALQRGVREILTEDSHAVDELDPTSPEALAIESERRAALRGAVTRLPGRERSLLSSMLASPQPTYEQLSSRLDMPVGSIGPTRDRALARLRKDTELGRAVTA